MKQLKISVFTLSLTALISACNIKPTQQHTEKVYKGISKETMDTTVNPCDDFYLYANGTWVKNNPVPETESRWGSFNEVRDNNNKILKEILEKSASDKNAEKGSNSQKIGDFYYCAMDSNKLNTDGITPLKPELEAINAIKTNDDIIKRIAQHHKSGIGSLFGIDVDQDAKKSDQYICYISQGGLNLPDRDYYLRKDEKSKKIREQYTNHVATMFTLWGYDQKMADSNSKTIMKIETELAKVSMTRVQLRDLEIQYNKMTLADFKKSNPTINWDLYLSEIGISFDELIVTQPDFFKKANELFNTLSKEEWKTYLTWMLINTTDDKLSAEIEQAGFDFYSTVLSGAKKMKPRWERVLNTINSSMGELLGQEFVKVAFSAENKNRVNEMVDNLILSFEQHINNLDWMGEETKKQAHIKLKSISRKLAYPDKWKDYSDLNVERDSYVTNWFRANRFQFNDKIGRLGKPIDKTEWLMPPQIVNAYYNPLMNEIVFPAGIMQPPFFTPDADDAVNYGSMGAVIGHELTHGFDDMGNKFDAEGNMKEWWTEEDRKKFDVKAKVVVDQFNGYEAMDSLFVNGMLTLGENMADLGGVAISYNAYQMSLKNKKRIDIDGFSPEQRFFISYAQVWRGNYTDEALRQQILTNPHSPGNFRVLGPLSNIPEFHATFNCTENTSMVRTDSIRAKVW